MTQEIESAQSVDELRQIPVQELETNEADSQSERNPGRLLAPVLEAFGSRFFQLGLVFLAGLLIGWLVLGWWLWPVQWTNALPWHLQSSYQERYLELVAETFWYSKDIRDARQALEGWDDAELAELLKRAQQNAANDEEHQQFTALAEALQYPTYETSLWSSLSAQKGILVGGAASVMLFAAAGALGVYSLLRSETEAAEEMRDVEDLAEAAAADGEEAEVGGSDDEMPEDVEEGDGLVVGALDEEEADDEEDDDFYDAEEDFYEEGEDVVDSLSAFMFDEEEEDISHLKDLCERLPEVDVSELLDEAQEVARTLRRGIELRARKPRF